MTTQSCVLYGTQPDSLKRLLVNPLSVVKGLRYTYAITTQGEYYRIGEPDANLVYPIIHQITKDSYGFAYVQSLFNPVGNQL